MKIEGRLWGKWQKKRGKEIKVSSRGEKNLCLFCVCLYIKGRRCHTEVSVCTNIKCYKKVKETIGCWVFTTDPGFLFIWLDSSRHIFCELLIFFHFRLNWLQALGRYIYIYIYFLSSCLLHSGLKSVSTKRSFWPFNSYFLSSWRLHSYFLYYQNFLDFFHPVVMWSLEFFLKFFIWDTCGCSSYCFILSVDLWQMQSLTDFCSFLGHQTAHGT